MAEQPKQAMSDAERLKLAAKLDKELDDFIDGLEKRRYTEGWPEDRWQEEMDKHPFFMKKPPEPGEELHPLLEGIQQLKYDPEENTAEDLATNYKEDGNFYIKNKKFRMAVMCFTEGLNAKSQNTELNAILYNNRSAANFFLKNYRSSLLDAQKALELKPDYTKARWRAAQCSFHTNKFDICLQYCDEILDDDPDNEPALELMERCRTKKLELERNARKSDAMDKRRRNEFQRVLDALKKRKIKFDDIASDKEISLEKLTPKLLPLEEHPVRLDGNGMLVWPGAFSFPEFLVSDFHPNLVECVLVEDYIYSVFADYDLPGDKEKKYRPGNLSVYYENRKAGTVHKVDMSKSFGEVIQEKDFFVISGTLLFYIVPKESQTEQDYLNEKRRPMAYS